MNRHDNALFGHREAMATVKPAEAEEGPIAMLADAARAARRRLLPLALWILVCLAGAGWYLYVTPSSFTATATVILDPKRSITVAPEAAASVAPPILDTAQADSQTQVIRSERLLSMVFDALALADMPELSPAPRGLRARVMEMFTNLLGLDRNAAPSDDQHKAAAFDNFVSRVGARRIGLSYVIEVTYTSADPSTARRLANAIVSAYLGQQVSFKLAAAQNGAEFLQARVNALANEVKAATDAVMAGTVPAAKLPDADARIIGAALQPLSRSAPKAGLVVGFAATFGLLTGLFAIAVASGLDRRIRQPDQLERDTGLPCLAVVPNAGRRKAFTRRNAHEMHRLARQEPEGCLAAAIRNARTSMLLSFDGKRSTTIGVASWSTGSGRSVIAANLAEVMAMSGAHVTLVDADIHRGRGGLTDLVPAVEEGLAECLVDPTGRSEPASLPFDDYVDLVPARASDGNFEYGAYLGSPRMREMIETWRQRGQVVFDLPALSAASDARAAAALLDGVILVVETGRTTTDEVERAVSALSRAGAVVIGAVMNGAVA